MDNKLPVYLNHLITRENLRYKRTDDHMSHRNAQPFATLDLCDLIGDHTASREKRLRKPDFQRSTWAWPPEKCFSLLKSILNGQVVPSVIMWRSADGRHDFVLDGAHRISVVMAWLRDDWGQSVAGDPDMPFDDLTRERIREAARIVRDMVRAQIGTFEDVKSAARQIEEDPKLVSDPHLQKQAMIYNRLNGREINFAIQWVRGDSRTAEQSFLDINKGGEPLSKWEITLIENRDSSFARTVMSVATTGTAQHYWPLDPPEGSDNDALRGED